MPHGSIEIENSYRKLEKDELELERSTLDEAVAKFEVSSKKSLRVGGRYLTMIALVTRISKKHFSNMARALRSLWSISR